MQSQTPSFPIAQTQKTKRLPTAIIIVLMLVGLVVGGLVGYAASYSDFSGKLARIQVQLQDYPQNSTYLSYPNITYAVGYNFSLSTLYQQVKSSVVVIQDLVPFYSLFGTVTGYSQQQGSGFITTVDNRLVIVTNDHVVQGSINQTVTFADGNTYPAKVLGSDPLADLAVLITTPMPMGLTPLKFVSSDSLTVGESVVAVGSPYGLSGTLTTGVVSALGRTITEESSLSQSGITIAGVIQTSTAINPGNSGGPLIDYTGGVVGITTAGISNSQGLGFAIPSDTIMRELNSLVTSGSYDQHPSIDVTGRDMNYQISQAMGTSVTYGFLVESVSTENGLKGGTVQKTILGSKVNIGGDIIIAVNGMRITNTDDLLSYLEQHALPGETASFTVVRNNRTETISVTVGKLS